MITTARMRLVPASVALARAELTDRAEFARLLSATVPDHDHRKNIVLGVLNEGFRTLV